MYRTSTCTSAGCAESSRLSHIAGYEADPDQSHALSNFLTRLPWYRSKISEVVSSRKICAWRDEGTKVCYFRAVLRCVTLPREFSRSFFVELCVARNEEMVNLKSCTVWKCGCRQRHLLLGVIGILAAKMRRKIRYPPDPE
jgi:hypothetical protein